MYMRRKSNQNQPPLILTLVLSGKDMKSYHNCVPREIRKYSELNKIKHIKMCRMQLKQCLDGHS